MSTRDVMSGIGIGIGFFIGQTAAQLLFAYIVVKFLSSGGAVTGGQMAQLFQ